MEDGSHDGDIEVDIHAEVNVLEELLAEGALPHLRLHEVNLEGLLEGCSRNTHLLREVMTGRAVLHQTASTTELAVPLDLLRHSTVEDKADWVLCIEISASKIETRIKIGIAHLAVLSHLAGNEVTVLKLIDEPLTLVIKNETTDTTESLSSQELHLGVGIIGVNETTRVNLILLEANTVRTKCHSKLLSVTSAVVAVGG